MSAILRRELHHYFRTPLGYIFMGLFLLVTGFFFAFGNISQGSPDFNAFLSSVLIVYLFAIPLLTMRLLSEERNQRTEQLLLTSPVRLLDIVAGKFLAAFVVFLITLAVTALYAIIIAVHGDLAAWETLGAYIGFILLGAAFIAVGLFVSALTENQITAAFFTFFVLLLIWLIDPIRRIAPGEVGFGVAFTLVAAILVGLLLYSNTRSALIGGAGGGAGAIAVAVVFAVDPTLFQGLIGKVLAWVSLLDRFQDFVVGVIKLDVVVFYFSFVAVFIYLTIRILEKRRWA